MAGNIKEIIYSLKKKNTDKPEVLDDLNGLEKHVNRLALKGSLPPYLPTEPNLNMLRAKRKRLIDSEIKKPRDLCNPDNVTNLQQKIWDANGIIINSYIEVTPCPFSREELLEGIAVFVPGQEELTYEEIGAIVPKTNDTYTMGLKDKEIKSAWYVIEPDIHADPNNKPEEANDLSARAYIIGAYNKKILGGELFDSKGSSWTWLPGSIHPQNRTTDQMPVASFQDGLLITMPWGPKAKSLDVRFRRAIRKVA